MSDQVSVKWRLIPDGSTSIVRLTIEGQFTVNTANATAEAAAGIAALVARISTEDEATIHDKVAADIWLGDFKRPDELDLWKRAATRAGWSVAGESEESAPSTSGRPHPRGDSSLSRRDPMPVLFVVGLAALSLSAVLGFITFGQFLVEISGGK